MSWRTLCGIAVGLVLGFVVVPLAVLVARPLWARDEVGSALARELAGRAPAQIDIGRLTRFEWDELFLFGPYHPRELVCARLQLDAFRCALSVAEGGMDDGEMLIAFRLHGSLVHSERHFRSNGDFTPLPDQQPLTRTTAVFDVVEDARMPYGYGPRLVARPSTSRVSMSRRGSRPRT